jgi:hypothetical protein
MSGAWRNLCCERRLQALLTGAVLVATVAGCGGEQRSGAVPADSSRSVTADTSAGSPADTSAAQLRDTSPATRSGTTAARNDTAKAVATRPAPPKQPAPKPAPKQASPKPEPTRSPQPSDTGTSAPTTGNNGDSSVTTSEPAETAAAPAQTSQTNAPLRDPYHRAPLDTVPQQVYDGWKQFNLNCARCHGEDAQGTTIAPHLIVSLKPDGPINTKELFVQTVCAGRPQKGMPSWCALGMEMPTIEAIYS